MKLLFIHVPWMKYYTGEGDEENSAPSSGYIFQNVNGYYYGYGEGLDYIALENFEGLSKEDDKAEDVLVVWTSKNKEGKNKIIGWYKKAEVYRNKKASLTLDSDRVELKYSIVARAENSILLPPEFRLFDAEDKEEAVAFEEDLNVMRDIGMYTHNYGGEKLNVLLDKKDLTAQSVLHFEKYEMYFSKADEFLAKDLYGKAMRCFNKAIALEPDLPMAYECKGSVLLSLKMYDEALEAYEKVLELERDNEAATYCIGLIYGLKEDYETCIAYLSLYIKKRQKDMYAVAERGIAYYNLGKMDKAREDFARAYQTESDNPIFRQLVAYAANQ